jgi:murein L,D-transpeptidase YcbB/YkuD
MDEETCARVRGAQRAAQREITGVVDQALALLLGNLATYGLIPVWFEAHDWSIAYAHLHCTEQSLENAVRRFQSHHHLHPTGVLDEETAIAIGD